jgi:chorismate mutase/prephenate dehydrogenase
MTLDELRSALNDLDRTLLELVARRQEIAREVATVKRATGYPTRDYAREREILLGVRERAAAMGVPADLAEGILRLLIRYSLATQEQASVAAHGAGSGQRALVIGGAGKMGGWFVQFLLSQGFMVEVSDPHGAPAGASSVGDWHKLELTHDYIVVATPLGATDTILRELALRRPPGVIFDLGSLKSPLRAGLNALTWLPRHLAASDVRSEHRVAVRPARDLRRPRFARCPGQGARAVRPDHGRAGGDVARRA